MTETHFETLIRRAMGSEEPNLFEKSEAVIYKEFELAEARHRANGGQARPGDNLHYKFEKVRLGVAVALMQVFANLADDEESKKVLNILKEAARGTTIAQIDAVINKNMRAFDSLYQDLYINEAGEMLLGLFERTLSADSKTEIDGIIREALKVLDFIQEG